MADTTVPGVVNMEEGMAVATLQRANLTPVLNARVHSNTVNSGRVVSQSESAGATVPEWSVVNIEVSDGPDPTAHVDYSDLRGATLFEAKRYLRDNGRRVVEEISEPSSEFLPGHVLRVEAVNPTEVRLYTAMAPRPFYRRSRTSTFWNDFKKEFVGK